MCCRPLPASPQHIIPTELFATNAMVDATNQHELARLPAPPQLFRAHDYVEPKRYPSGASPFGERACHTLICTGAAQRTGVATVVPVQLRWGTQS